MRAVLGDPAPRPQPASTGTPARQRARDWAGTGQQETRESAGEEGILSLWTRPASHISPQRTGKVTLLEGAPCEPRIPDQFVETQGSLNSLVLSQTRMRREHPASSLLRALSWSPTGLIAFTFNPT